jgi:hypothetical protein
MFFVRDETWLEHDRVGIAGINDPGKGSVRRNNALAEVAGIRRGDRIFFKVGKSEEHPGLIRGLYEAQGSAYFDPSPLFKGAKAVGKNLPFRIEFRCVKRYEHPVAVEYMWLSKERGDIWTIQQSRGDVLGRHACQSISQEEADLLGRVLN